MKKKEKVIILGGGIAGMSAAHELAERGFEVAVYEMLDIPGGKARSIPFSHSEKEGRKPLPGEHGFRFFPGFYQHITDTMKRIPYGNNPQGVFDNLMEATRIAIPRFDKAGLTIPARTPKNYGDVRLLVKVLLDFLSDQAPLQDEEISFFARKIWQLMTSSKERRIGEYEKIDWWTFVEAENRSYNYQSLLAKGLTESLVASKAKLASTKTVGDIFLQLLFDLINPTVATDRLLNGPTNEVWLDPWLTYLKALGVDYHFNSRVESISYNATKNKVDSVVIQDTRPDGVSYTVTGDYYIAALPVEVMDRLINRDRLDQDNPIFQNIRALAKHINWMNGIQFYLKEDVPITHGHVLLVDTPWALTAISQKQFWSNADLSEYGDGTVKGILSVVISDWGIEKDEEGSRGIQVKKFASDCTNKEIKEEVWAELQKSLNVDGKMVLKDENLHSYFIDPAIRDLTKTDLKQINRQVTQPRSAQFVTRAQDSTLFSKDQLLKLISTPLTVAETRSATLSEDPQDIETAAIAPADTQLFSIQNPDPETSFQTLVDLGAIKEVLKDEAIAGYKVLLNPRSNVEPLLVNEINTWHLRPNAAINIPNLFLASDYVQTNTDLATMEGANEAARRAVNAILGLSGHPAQPCKIWELHEPEIFAPLRWTDEFRYRQGLPWKDYTKGFNS